MRRAPGGRIDCFEVELLEPRILYSADVLAVFSGAASDSESEPASATGDGSAFESRLVSDSALFESSAAAAPLSVIDARVPKLQALLDTLRAQGHDILVVDVAQDGIAAISDALDAGERRAAVHVFAHGEGEGLRLGDALVDSAMLDGRSEEIRRWSTMLDDEADILLWACDLAGSVQGRELVAALAQHTGADVAASVDATGHADLGGDWNLETRIGDVDEAAVATGKALSDWSGTLRIIEVSNLKDGLRDPEFDFEDIDDGATNVTLREAINAINQESSIEDGPTSGETGSTGTGTSGGGGRGGSAGNGPGTGTNGSGGSSEEQHVIRLAPGEYRLTMPGVDEGLNGTGDLDLLASMTLQGSSSDSTTIIQVTADRVLDVRGTDLQIKLDGLTVQGGEVRSNSLDGGGLQAPDDTVLTLSDVRFVGNTAAEDGAAVSGGGTLTITDSRFEGNVAGNSGGAVFTAADLSVERSTFTDNRAERGRGGAIIATEPTASVRLTDVQFERNAAPGAAGGAVYLFSDDARLQRVTFAANQAVNGGALGIWRLDTVVENATFLNNTATGAGGAIYSILDFTLTSSSLVGNEAGTLGGAIRLGEGDVGTLSANLFVDNVANQGPDVHGTVNSLGYNLFESLDGMSFTSADNERHAMDLLSAEAGRDVVADSLAKDGGYVSTLALAGGSIAINAAGSTQAGTETGPVVDANQRQRDEIHDIGASESPGRDDVLFYADEHGRIWRSSPSLAYPQLIIDAAVTNFGGATFSLNQTHHLEVDISTGVLFLLYQPAGQIHLGSADGMGPLLEVGEPDRDTVAIALDPHGKRLFVLKGGDEPGIVVLDYSGNLISTVAGTSSIDSPGDLAYDALNDRLVWTQRAGASSGLYRIGVDGTDFEQLPVSEMLVDPAGLHLDSAGHRVYVVDDGLKQTLDVSLERDTQTFAAGTGQSITYGAIRDLVVIADANGSSVTRFDESLAVQSGPDDVPVPIRALTMGSTSGEDALPTVGGSLQASVVPGGLVILLESALSATDDTSSSEQLTWQVVDQPTRGRLLLDDIPFDELPPSARYFTQAELSDGHVSYQHDPDADPGDDTIALTLHDGRAAELVIASLAIEVQAAPPPPRPQLNAAPQVQTVSVDVPQGGTQPISTSTLSVSDPDGAVANTRLLIDTGDSGITLHDTAADVAVTEFTWQQLDDGTIELRADDTEVGQTPVMHSFLVTVLDAEGERGEANWEVSFRNQNDAPVVEANTVRVPEGGSKFLSEIELKVSDSDGTGLATLITMDTLEASTGLTLHVDGGAATDTFTAQQLADGVVELRADGREPSAEEYALSVGVTDPDGASSASEWKVEVFQTNDPLQLQTGPEAVPLVERASAALTTSQLRLSDADGLDTAAIYTWAALPEGLSIANATDGAPLTRFSQQQLVDGEIAVSFDDTEPQSSLYELLFTARAPNEEEATAVLSISVSNDNDVPSLLTTDIEVSEGGRSPVSVTELQLSDDDGLDVGARFIIDTDSPDTGLSLYSLNQAQSVSEFTWQQLDEGDIELRADGREPTDEARTLLVTVIDSAGASAASDWSITVRPTNDGLQLSAGKADLAERGFTPLDTSMLMLHDSDGLDVQTRYGWDTLPTGMSVVLGADGTPQSDFTQRQLEAGEISLAFDDTEPESDPYPVTMYAEDGNGDSATAVLTVLVTGVNDEPVLVTNDASVPEGSQIVLSNAELRLSDGDDIDPATRFTIDTDGQSTGVSLRLEGVGQISDFSWQELQDERVTLHADEREPKGTAHALSVRVDDPQGGTTTQTWYVDVEPVNDVMLLQAGELELLERGSTLLDTTHLALADGDGIDPDSVYTWSALPAGLSFAVNGDPAPLTAFTQQQLGDGEIWLAFDDTEPQPEPYAIGMVVTATDGERAEAILTVSVQQANDIPALFARPAAIAEGGERFVTLADLELTDDDGIEPSSVFTLDTQLQATGLSLHVEGGPATDRFTWQQLQDGAVQLRADEREPDPAAHALLVMVDDTEGGTAAAEWDITVEPVNDTLQLGAGLVDLVERGTVPLEPEALQLSDGDGVNTASVYTWNELPAGLSFVQLSDGTRLQEFTQQRLLDGEIALSFDDTEPQAAPYSVEMFATAPDGERAYADLTVRVDGQNDNPMLSTRPFSLAEGGARPMSTNDLIFGDEDGIEPSSVFTLDTRLQSTGLSLHVEGGPATDRFTWQQWQDGAVELRADEREPSASAHTLLVTVDDTEGGTASAEWDITVEPVNDALQLSAGLVDLVERGTVPLEPEALQLSDGDGVNTASVYTWNELPAGLSFVQLSDGTRLQEFTQQRLLDGEIALSFDDTEPQAAPYSVEMFATAPDGERAYAELTVRVDGRNDNPVLSTRPFTVVEGTARPMTSNDMSFSDGDGDGIEPPARFAIDTQTQATGLSLHVADSAATDGFTWQQLQDGMVELRADEREPSSDAHAVRATVDDGQGGEAATMLSISVENRNDAPVASQASLTFEPEVAATWVLPADAFIDVDSSVLSYRAVEVDGEELPDWLAFDPETGRFTLTDLPPEQRRFDMLLVATDDDGAEASTVVTLLFGEPPPAAAVPVEPPPAATVPVEPPLTAAAPAEPSLLPQAPEDPAQPASVAQVIREDEPPTEAIEQADAAAEPATEAEVAAEPLAGAAADVVSVDLRALIQSLPDGAREVAVRADVAEQAIDVQSFADRVTQAPLDTLDLEALVAQLNREGEQADPALLEALGRERERLAEQAAFAQTVVGGTVGVTSGLSIGYLIWLIRGGTLAGSVLSSLPAWRFVDPLPVLGSLDGNASADDDESLQSMVDGVANPATADVAYRADQR